MYFPLYFPYSSGSMVCISYTIWAALPESLFLHSMITFLIVHSWTCFRLFFFRMNPAPTNHISRATLVCPCTPRLILCMGVITYANSLGTSQGSATHPVMRGSSAIATCFSVTLHRRCCMRAINGGVFFFCIRHIWHNFLQRLFHTSACSSRWLLGSSIEHTMADTYGFA